MWAVSVVGFSAGGASASVAHNGPGQNLGPNVIVLSPSMSQSTIQSTSNMIAAQQVPNQFDAERYAILFEPGTYGSDTVVLGLGFRRRSRQDGNVSMQTADVPGIKLSGMIFDAGR